MFGSVPTALTCLSAAELMVACACSICVVSSIVLLSTNQRTRMKRVSFIIFKCVNAPMLICIVMSPGNGSPSAPHNPPPLLRIAGKTRLST